RRPARLSRGHAVRANSAFARELERVAPPMITLGTRHASIGVMHGRIRDRVASSCARGAVAYALGRRAWEPTASSGELAPGSGEPATLVAGSAPARSAQADPRHLRQCLGLWGA